MSNSPIRKQACKQVYDFISKYIALSEQEFSLIEEYWVVRRFPKRSVITAEKRVEEYFNIITTGVARKYTLVEDQEITRQLVTEGDPIFSEVSFITRRPSKVIIESLDDTVLISIHHSHVKQLFKELPQLERLGRLILTDMFVEKDRRDYDNLSTTVRERFLNYIRRYPHLLQRVPQKYLASYLNIKPETFSRLKHLTQQKRR